MVLVIAACGDGVQPTGPTAAGESTGNSAPTPVDAGLEVTSSPSPDVGLPGETLWILESLDGRPLIEESFATLLKVDGDWFGGFDGCNSYGGRSDDGVPIADADGRFSVQHPERTEQDCPEPEGIMDQADAYISALVQGERFRIVDDRLEILDSGGAVRLILVRQATLPGHPVSLEGTEWQLLTEGNAMDGVRAPTVVFLDHRIVTGVTACRNYVATYRASEGNLLFPGKSMLRSTQSCGEDARILEGEFGDFLTWAREYSVHQEGGSIRLMIRSIRGETLTFEPLPEAVWDISEAEWSLMAFVEFRLESGMWHHRTINVVRGTEMTMSLHEDSLGGFSGCNSYGGPAKVKDGSITIDAQRFLHALKLCEQPELLMEQEKRYLDLVHRVTRYSIFGDGLFMQTDNDVFLLFQVRPGN